MTFLGTINIKIQGIYHSDHQCQGPGGNLLFSCKCTEAWPRHRDTSSSTEDPVRQPGKTLRTRTRFLLCFWRSSDFLVAVSLLPCKLCILPLVSGRRAAARCTSASARSCRRFLHIGSSRLRVTSNHRRESKGLPLSCPARPFLLYSLIFYCSNRGRLERAKVLEVERQPVDMSLCEHLIRNWFCTTLSLRFH